jgi:hypothetical protein
VLGGIGLLWTAERTTPGFCLRIVLDWSWVSIWAKPSEERSLFDGCGGGFPFAITVFLDDNWEILRHVWSAGGVREAGSPQMGL